MIKIFKRVCLVLSIVLIFSCPVFAGNQNNVYNDIYSITQYTTIRQLLDDSHFKPSNELINQFLNEDEYVKKYIISFCNSGNCENDINNRSIALLGLSEKISADFVQDGRNLQLKLTGPDDSKLYFYHNTGALPVNGVFALSLFNSSRYTTFNNFRGILPCASVSDIDSLLPSMLFDKVFTNLKNDLKDMIINNINFILSAICIVFFIPLLLWFFKNVRRYLK